MDEQDINTNDQDNSVEPSDLEQQLEDITAKAEENLKGWQRAIADFENYKRRDQEHHAELLAYGQEQALQAFLKLTEDLDRILAHLPQSQDQIAEWTKGVSGVRKNLDEVFRDFGLERIKTVGEKFDPQFHEAVAQVAGDQEDTIAEEIAPGYRRGEKLLKPAQVKVFKKGN